MEFQYLIIGVTTTFRLMGNLSNSSKTGKFVVFLCTPKYISTNCYVYVFMRDLVG